MPMIKHVDGVDIEMTPEEEAEFLAALPPPPVDRVPQSITRRQCAKRLLAMGMISGEEALLMTRHGEPPAAIAASFAQLSPDDAVLAEIDFAADTYMRSNPLLINLMEATGASEREIDDFFREAALL